VAYSLSVVIPLLPNQFLVAAEQRMPEALICVDALGFLVAFFAVSVCYLAAFYAAVALLQVEQNGVVELYSNPFVLIVS